MGDRARRTYGTTAIQRVTLLFAVAFLVVGVLGFVPVVTTDVDAIALMGHESGAELFGIFQVSVLHNLLHLVLGAAGLVLMRSPGRAKFFLVGGGVAYLALWVYGVAVDRASPANVVPVNAADNWLHLGLGVAMMLLGLAVSSDRTRSLTP
jgi:hypothetical protein